MNNRDNDKQEQESPPEPPLATPDVLEEGITRREPPAAQPDLITKAEDRTGQK